MGLFEFRNLESPEKFSLVSNSCILIPETGLFYFLRL